MPLKLQMLYELHCCVTSLLLLRLLLQKLMQGLHLLLLT
jgi:hypothetical protein